MAYRAPDVSVGRWQEVGPAADSLSQESEAPVWKSREVKAWPEGMSEGREAGADWNAGQGRKS